MKRLNEQLFTDLRDSVVSLGAIVNDTQTIERAHPIESNTFQEPKDSSLSRAYQSLDEVQQQRWQALSVFPNQFDCAAAAAVWRMADQQAASALLKALEAQALVLSLPSQDARRYMLDESVRVFASARLTADEHQEALFHHANYYKEILQQAAWLYEQGGEALERGLALFEQEWPNIQAGQFWCSDYAAKNQKAAALCCQYQEVGGYMLLVGLDNEEWLAWQQAAVMASKYLDDSQNKHQREGYEREALNSDATEGEPNDIRTEQGWQASVLSAEREALETKALKLAHEAARLLEADQVELAIERLQEQLALVSRFDDEDELWEAKILYQLGNAYYLLEDIEFAIEFYQQSNLMMRNMNDLEGDAYTLLGLGRAYAELGELDYAIGFYESCLQILCAEDNDQRAEAHLLEELGNAYELLGDLPGAIAFYERLLACASQREGSESHRRALGYLGKAYHKGEQYKEAIECYKQQVALEQQGGNQSVEAKTLRLLGQAYVELGEYQAAITCYQRQLSLVRALKKPEEEESTLWYLGVAHHKAGQIKEASQCYQHQLAITRLLGNAEEEMYALEYLGLAYHKIGQVKQAIDCHEQQLTIAHQLEDWSSKARALEYLGLTYAELGELPQAIEYFEQQLTIVSMFESRQAEARTLAYLANAYSLAGDGSHAIKLYQQALQLNRQLKDKAEEASNLWHLSLALSQQDNIQTAISYAKASLGIHEQLKASAMRAGDGAMERASATAFAEQATKIRQQLQQWEQKGTMGTFMNAFKRTLRVSLFPAT